MLCTVLAMEHMQACGGGRDIDTLPGRHRLDYNTDCAGSTVVWHAHGRMYGRMYGCVIMRRSFTEIQGAVCLWGPAFLPWIRRHARQPRCPATPLTPVPKWCAASFGVF